MDEEGRDAGDVDGVGRESLVIQVPRHDDLPQLVWMSSCFLQAVERGLAGLSRFGGVRGHRWPPAGSRAVAGRALPPPSFYILTQ